MCACHPYSAIARVVTPEMTHGKALPTFRKNTTTRGAMLARCKTLEMMICPMLKYASMFDVDEDEDDVTAERVAPPHAQPQPGARAPVDDDEHDEDETERLVDDM